MLADMIETTAEPVAWLTEAFSSVQGEGPYAGVRQIFVRFYGCHRQCAYCDSPETVTAWQPPGFKPHAFRVEVTPGARDFRELENPVTVGRLLALLREFDQPPGLHHAVALTGGEPLLHARYLCELLPRLEHLGLKTYLETAGDLFHELELLLPWLDIAAMDIKLPSVTRNEPAWPAHRQFLRRCVENEVEVFAKAVVSADTDPRDLEQACAVLREVAPDTLLVLQPMTPFGAERRAPGAEQLLAWHALARTLIPHVRVIPQVHKFMDQL